MKGKGIAAVIIAATIAVTLFNPIATIVSENSGTQSVTNETATADAGAYVDLEGYNAVAGSETVYYEDGGSYTTATEGTDYEWKDESASVKALTSGNISDGSNLKVSYDYQATSGTQTTVITLIPLFVALLILGVIGAKIQQGL